MFCLSFATFGFIVLALTLSGYYGFFAFEIHKCICGGAIQNSPDCTDIYGKCGFPQHKNIHFKLTQIFFNFSGALLGWLTLFIILPFQEGFHIEWTLENLKFLLPLSYIAYIGITGRLPYITTALENPLKKIFSN